MNDLHYIYIKLNDTVHSLATSEGNIKLRLQYAASTHLPFVFSKIEALPNDLKSKLKVIEKSLTNKEPTFNEQSTIEATMYRMHKKTASKIAENIWELNRMLLERKLTGNWSEFET